MGTTTFYKIKCSNCGKEFVSKRPQGEGRRYCSDKCRGQANYTPTPKDVYVYHCDQCGMTFLSNRKRKPDGNHYCSVKCRTEYLRLKRLEALKATQ